MRSAPTSTTDGPISVDPHIVPVVVMLCSLWPTLINTAIGTASIDKDLLNVGRVLRLGWFAKLTRLVLPSSLPYIFTGMRLSLGTGWMAVILCGVTGGLLGGLFSHDLKATGVAFDVPAVGSFTVFAADDPVTTGFADRFTSPATVSERRAPRS